MRPAAAAAAPVTVNVLDHPYGENLDLKPKVRRYFLSFEVRLKIKTRSIHDIV